VQIEDVEDAILDNIKGLGYDEELNAEVVEREKEEARIKGKLVQATHVHELLT